MCVYTSGDYSNKQPEWYRRNGLHDAKIIAAEFLELDPDYKSWNPVFNSLTLTMDLKQALYDMTVKKLTFCNCKILTPDIKIDGFYWLQDVLTYENDRFALNITVPIV